MGSEADEFLSCDGDPELLRALHASNWNQAEELIKHRQGLHSRTQTTGSTALHLATFNCAPENIVAALLEAGVDVTAVDASGFSCLYFAALKGLADVCKVILKYGGDPNQTASLHGGLTPMHAAIFPGTSVGLLQVLIDAGGDPNVAAKSAEMTELFHKRGCDTCPLYDSVTPLILAVMKDAPQAIIETLLQNGADPSIKDGLGKTALDYARVYQRDHILPLLTPEEKHDELKSNLYTTSEKILEPHLETSSAFDTVISINEDETKKLLNKKKIDTDVDEFEPCNGPSKLLQALNDCNWTFAEQLIKEGDGLLTKTHLSQWTALHFATFNCAPVRIVEALLESGVSVNAVDTSGFSCLYFAAQKGLVDVCRVIVKHGGDPNQAAKGNGGLTPMHAAIFPETSSELLLVLLEAGGNPNNTAQSTEMAALLKTLGCSSAPLYDGVTPLILAVIKAVPVAIIETLLQSGADPSIKDGQNKNSLDHARELGHNHFIPMLLLAEDTEELQKRRCEFCKRVSQVYLPRCSGCDLVVYCNIHCQRQAWKNHKLICRNRHISQSVSSKTNVL